jgi:hypothetical protein
MTSSANFWWKALWFLVQCGRAPNPWAQERVAARLAARPCFSKDDWYSNYWRDQGVAKAVCDHIYDRFAFYSKIRMGQVRPSDKLLTDLEFDKVCWSDWDLDHFEDFKREFKTDIAASYPVVDSDTTIGQLVTHLNERVRTCPSLPLR